MSGTESRHGLGARDLGLVALICLAWAGNFITSKLALAELPPLLFTAMRLGVLAVILLPFLKRPPPGQSLRLVVVALCIGVMHFGLSFWAIRLSNTIASPAIVMQSYVPMASLLAWFWLGERFHWRTGAAIALSFAGVLVLGLDPGVFQAPAALLLMLVSALFLAMGTVLLRRLTGLDPVSQQGWTALIALGPLLVWSVLAEPGGIEALRHASWIAWAGIIYAAVVASLLGHGIYYVLMQRHPVAQVTPYLLATPLLATVMGIVLLGDRVGPRLWLGGAMVLGGVLGLSLRNGKKGINTATADVV